MSSTEVMALSLARSAMACTPFEWMAMMSWLSTTPRRRPGRWAMIGGICEKERDYGLLSLESYDKSGMFVFMRVSLCLLRP